MRSWTLYFVSMSVLNSYVRVEIGSGCSQSLGLTASAIDDTAAFYLLIRKCLRRCEVAFSEKPLGDRIISYTFLLKYNRADSLHIRHRRRSLGL